ncbi:unnamed protein product [Adineta ricciae]|uniref:Transmembrane protein 231 n=1 Tax=Adineta ricciae TaxID=249248 RepID=A0A815HJ35_ADIRI|nr:unnamed protein product [Adineta ricciae]CAF1355494.1 unnamed protein product [Adineta ricciae]
MVLYKVYSQDHRIRYFAHPCSSAVLFQLWCLLFTFLSPLFTSYFTSGFYYKELSYTEQPNISSLKKLQLSIGSSSGVVFSSTDQRENNYFSSIYAPGTLRTAIPWDIDGDGIIDQQNITYEVILTSSVADKTVNIWPIFSYKLNQYPQISMDALGLISLKAPPGLLSNAIVTVYGQLRFQQLQPISNHTDISSLQSPVIDYGSYSIVPSFDQVLKNYTSRPYFTTFDQEYVKWSSSSVGGTKLTVKIIVVSSLQTIRYVPSFWKEFRWQWIQCVTALIPFLYIMNKAKEFVFSNQLVRTIVKKSP